MLASIILVVHLMIAAALVGVVLLQRSEGGALGIGGGGGGGFLTGRGTANLLTRTTAGLAAAFFVTSILLTLTAQRAVAPTSLFGRDGSAPVSAPTGPGPSKVEPKAVKPGAPAAGGLTDKLPLNDSGAKLPQVPQSK